MSTTVSEPPAPVTPAPEVDPRPALVSVEARRLRKSFGDVEVIHGLDLAVEPGTIVGLIGPSGCGKTTTVRLLTGLLAPTSGEAMVRPQVAPPSLVAPTVVPMSRPPTGEIAVASPQSSLGGAIFSHAAPPSHSTPFPW